MTGDAGADGLGAHLRQLLATAEERNAATLDHVADRVVAAIAADLRVHTTGTGHSSALVLETFYRAGGLACINPITHPGLVPLAGAIASTALERRDDLAAPLLAQAAPVGGEVAVVFSSSGANPLPVALAQGLKAAGVFVVAVSSLPHLRAAPARAGTKLDAVADAVLDTGVPVGDATYEVGELRTAPASSLLSIFLWDLLLARVADRAARADVDLPLWTSSNTVGGDERNLRLLEQYRPRIPSL